MTLRQAGIATERPRLAPPARAAAPVTFHANVAMPNYGLYGMFALTLTDALGTEQISPDFIPLWCGDICGDEYIGIGVDSENLLPVTFYTFDPVSWQLKQMVESYEISTLPIYDVCCDPTTGWFYGFGYTDDFEALQFCRLYPEEGRAEQICETDMPVVGMAASPDGEIYAVDYMGQLVKLDKTTGEAEVIGDTGLPIYDLYIEHGCSGFIDSASNTFYLILNTSLWLVDEAYYTTLVAIDMTTAEASEVFSESEMYISGAYIPRVASTADGAPAQPERLSVDFAPGAYSGSVSFAAPTLLYDGTAAEGECGYSVVADNEEIASGTCAYGATVTVDAAFEAKGWHSVRVRCSNGAGEGPSASARVYAGFDTPRAVAQAIAEYDEAAGKIVCQWTPTYDGVEGGTLGDVSYNVYCNGALIASGITGTFFKHPVPSPSGFASYRYGVSAVSEGLESEITMVSSDVTLGSHYFNSEADLEGWTIIDANEDDQTWHFESAGLSGFAEMYDNDDWLISPSYTLRKGCYYEFYLGAHIVVSEEYYNALYPLKYEIKMGEAPTVEAMTISAVEDKQLYAGPRDHVYINKIGFVAPEDGDYHFGIHNIETLSGSINHFLVFTALTDGCPPGTPGAATALTITPDSQGAHKATVAFTAPTADFAGAPIDELTKAEIYLDGVIAQTIENPAPGESFTTELSVAHAGYYPVSVVCSNSCGAGMAAEAKAFIGVNVPGAPAWAKVKEGDTEGDAVITWGAAPDCDGWPLNPDLLDYAIVDADGIVAQNVKGNEFSYQAVDEGDQRFVMYGVYAHNTSGYGDTPAITGMVACGTPIEGPIRESARGAKFDYQWGSEINNPAGADNCYWFIGDDKTFGDVQSQDGDNGYMGMFSLYTDVYADLRSEKILLPETNPMLSLWYYVIEGNYQDANKFEIMVTCDGKTTTAGSWNHSMEQAGWYKAELDLSEYAGKVITFSIVPHTVNQAISLFDNIYIGGELASDLSIWIDVPADETRAGKDAIVNYTVRNLESAAEGYSVELYLDGQLQQTITDLPALEADGSYTGSISVPTNAKQTKKALKLQARVVYEPDGFLSNNESETVKITVKSTDYPDVALSGEYDEALHTVTLTWDEPAIEKTYAAITEDFESSAYEAFTIYDFGPWILECENPDGTYGFIGYDWKNKYQPQGFILFDAGKLKHDVKGTRGSDRYLAAWTHSNLEPNNAWFISPMLDGKSQKVTFCAAVLDPGENETIKAYYSLTDTELTSFEEIEIAGMEGGLSRNWTEYSFTVPADAKYFALKSTGGYKPTMAMIDDITYRGPVGFGYLTVKGYNVYRNGLKINDELVTETTYVDNNDSEDTYVVTVVYDYGESRGSNEYVVAISSLGSVVAPKAAVKVVDRSIVIEGAASALVTSIDGRVIYSAKGQPSVTVPVAPGVYVVSTGDRALKVVVR